VEAKRHARGLLQDRHRLVLGGRGNGPRHSKARTAFPRLGGRALLRPILEAAARVFCFAREAEVLLNDCRFHAKAEVRVIGRVSRSRSAAAEITVGLQQSAAGGLSQAVNGPGRFIRSSATRMMGVYDPLWRCGAPTGFDSVEPRWRR
jgi:hypothetical protein